MMRIHQTPSTRLVVISLFHVWWAGERPSSEKCWENSALFFAWAAFVMASLRDFPVHHHTTHKEQTVWLESQLFPPVTFPGSLQLCFEEGHTGGRVTKTGPALQSPVPGCGCLKTELHEEEMELGFLISSHKRRRSRLCVLFPYSIITHLPSEVAPPSVFIFLQCNKNSIISSSAWAVSTVALNSILSRNN